MFDLHKVSNLCSVKYFFKQIKCNNNDMLLLISKGLFVSHIIYLHWIYKPNVSSVSGGKWMSSIRENASLPLNP